MRRLCVSECDFCNWVGSRSDHIQTLNEPYQSWFWKRTETTSSAGSRCGCLVRTRVWLLYSHLPKRSAPRRETNLSSLQSNQTWQVWIHLKIHFFRLMMMLTFTRYVNIMWIKDLLDFLYHYFFYIIDIYINLHHITSVSQQWMLCSEWVPSEWESDKNITIIHK